MDNIETAIANLICSIIFRAVEDYKKSARYIIKHSDYNTATGATKQRHFTAMKERIKKLNFKRLPVSIEEKTALAELENDKERIHYFSYCQMKTLKADCEEFFNSDYINTLSKSINGKDILAELERQINDEIKRA